MQVCLFPCMFAFCVHVCVCDFVCVCVFILFECVCSFGYFHACLCCVQGRSAFVTECVSVYMWFCLSGGLMDNLSAALAKDCLVRMLTTSV